MCDLKMQTEKCPNLETRVNKDIYTGYMSDCVSIIFFCKNKLAYGIHWNGGVNEKRVKCTIMLFNETKALCNSIKIIFGSNYANDKKGPSPYIKDLLCNTIPLFKEITHNIEVFCSSFGKFNIDGEILTDKKDIIWYHKDFLTID